MTLANKTDLHSNYSLINHVLCISQCPGRKKKKKNKNKTNKPQAILYIPNREKQHGNVVCIHSTMTVGKRVYENKCGTEGQEILVAPFPPVTSQHPHTSPSAVVKFLYNGNNIILLPPKRLQLTLILMKLCSSSPKNGDTKSCLYLCLGNVKLATIPSVYSIT